MRDNGAIIEQDMALIMQTDAIVLPQHERGLPGAVNERIAFNQTCIAATHSRYIFIRRANNLGHMVLNIANAQLTQNMAFQ